MLFLGYTRKFHTKYFNEVQYSREARSVFFRELIRNPARWKVPIKAVIPDGIRIPIKAKLERLNRKDKKLPEIGTAFRKELERRFDQDVRALEERLQRDLKDAWF